jgi:hypothetical protein
MKAVASKPLTLASKQAVIGDLTRGFTSALPDGKSRHWAHAISRLAQRFECFGQSKSQRADHACSHNGDAGTGLFSIGTAWFSHGWKEKNLPRDFYCFLRRSILQVSPNENEARKLVDCQLSLFSDDLKSDKREQ